jgi:hypothetical protein
VLSTLLLVPSAVHADGPFEGEWRRGARTVTVSVATWGADCGPRPSGRTEPAAGPVTVTQEGDHLSFSHGRSTRSCWSENPAVRRVSNSVSAGTWRIVCRTPPDDSRQETGTTTIRAASPDTLELRDVTEYDWTLNESHCTATETTTQTFTRVAGAAPVETPPPATTPEPEPTPSCTPGAAARIALRPASSEVEPGGRACLSARVVDAAGCPLRDVVPTLLLRAPEGRAGELRGTCFEAARGADAEGEFTVLASAGELRAEAGIRVASVDLSDLTAGRSDRSGAGGGGGSASAGEAAGVAARNASSGGLPWWFAALAAGLGLALALGAALMLLARRRKRERALAEAAERAAQYAAAASVPPPSPPSPATQPPAGGAALICPSCRRGYPPGADRCARDGSALVPYATFVQQQDRQLLCPKCGTRYPSATRFCGKDGSTLDPA